MNATVTFFNSVWLLLLIVPVFLAIFALVFARKKKGIKITPNLVLSTLFQCLVALIFVFAISGVGIEYDEEYVPREAVVLVDTSNTTVAQRESMDGFVHDVLKQSVGQCKVGVVLFGRGQKVALEMETYTTSEAAEKAYKQYKKVLSATPYDNATDISSALKFLWSPTSNEKNFISDPTRTRIVILSDGLETDGDAIGAMKELTRNGAQLETSFYANAYDTDTSIINVEYPAQAVYTGDNFNISVTVKCSHKEDATLVISDTDESGSAHKKTKSLTLQAGTQKFNLEHVFESGGFHTLSFQLEVEDDQNTQNNVFSSYFEVSEKEKVLILEAYPGETDSLKTVLSDAAQKGHIEIEVKDLKTVSDETTENQFDEYSEVILYNFAVKDMTEEFQTELKKYVEKTGGGLFTVGGFKKDADGTIQETPKESDPSKNVPVLRSYNESDMRNSVLADLLPVDVEAYKPSTATIFIFDVSRSMTSTDGAIISAVSDANYIIKNVLDTRDYVGILKLQDTYEEESSNLVPMSHKDDLVKQISDLAGFWEFYASTKYAPAITKAKDMLAAAPSEVARKHIILFSDGGPGDKPDAYLPAMREASRQGITLTLVTYYKSVKVVNGKTYYFNHSYDVPGWEINIENMQDLAAAGNGSFVLLLRNSESHDVAPYFKDDLKLDQLADICYEDFNPVKSDESQILDGVTGLALGQLKLNGYFPSRAKIGGNINVPIRANGAPLYAEWEVGDGKVGSILIDLEGKWSSELLTTDTGQRIVNNIFLSLMRAVEPPVSHTYEAMLTEDNFHTHVNVFNLEQEDSSDTKIVALVQAPDKSLTKFDLGTLARGTRFTFENSEVGVYSITIMKVPVDYDFMGSNISSVKDIPPEKVLETIKLYRSFSYSREYDITADPYSTGQDLLSSLSTREATDGLAYSKFIYEADKVFAPYGTVHRTNNLRNVLLISAMVLYLLGIIFRLFKIKKFRSKSRAKV